MAAPFPWIKLSGDKRIVAEFKHVQNLIKNGTMAQIYDLTMVQDNQRLWRFKAKNFDNDLEGGRQLNEDLTRLFRKWGQDHLLMEISFPADYPTSPFFLRMVTPRCCWYTGHVTAGGSICIQALVNTPGGWQADYSVESIMNLVFANMLDAEVAWIETPTGPGGLSGPLRVDLEKRWHGDVLTPYSEHEARAGYQRTVNNHGWKVR